MWVEMCPQLGRLSVLQIVSYWKRGWSQNLPVFGCPKFCLFDDYHQGLVDLRWSRLTCRERLFGARRRLFWHCHNLPYDVRNGMYHVTRRALPPSFTASRLSLHSSSCLPVSRH
ncbi:uncharacterized protein CANTADRAFT_189700 [Suhomyces tanzawaensis NRRL Y-17324]|uniref:Uncharacterized protein n=1 Tax=Suhomyces tanzawaensis NRRL Y-17324 TaxID=984487 RepID=A0A1E4SNH3_9ASCO|nr:uncharacterized protein CANTADRAFT_189700 [Suhomyces tanzawaensis NRRL Y-17324]ODV81046.1 hypothetical protein CANTADRAFT_189700 [Suhomyces tanzawaensis NRRL Y-17324]